MAGVEETGKQRSRRPVQEAMVIGMLGGRQVTPRWENDPVWQNYSKNGREGQGGCGYYPSRRKIVSI